MIDLDSIDPRFIDAVFPEFDDYVFGELRPDTEEGMAELCASLPAYEDAYPPIPTNEWVEISRETERQNAGIEWLVPRVMNQGREGSCVANMTASQLELCQAKQFGLDNVIPLSAISLYQLIGSSASSGAYVPDALKYGKSFGMLPLDTPENREKFGDCVMPHTGWRERRPNGADEVAGMFAIDEAYVIKTYEGLVSAGLRGDTAGVGREGHSIDYLRPTFKTSSVNSLLYIYLNSWAESFGFAMGRFKGGFGADTPRQVQKSAGYAFSVTAVVVPKFRFKL